MSSLRLRNNCHQVFRPQCGANFDLYLYLLLALFAGELFDVRQHMCTNLSNVRDTFALRKVALLKIDDEALRFTFD